MARPKKYTNGSKVISLRVPIAAEKFIRKIIEQGLKDWTKPTNVVKPFEQPTTNYQENTNVDHEEIKKKIAEIKLETIPSNRDTLFGRKAWNMEQDKKIKDLQQQLQNPNK